MTDIAISVSNVSKCYQVFDDQRSKFLHAVWHKHTKGMQEVWALKDINFEIKRGEAVAIIGRNGGGKSTLLQILTGTLTSTTGEVKVNGRVSALLELGSGFNPEYSGRDNVILNGLLLGLSREQILSRFHEIEAFAEIGAAIDRPVKTYSSGMMMRLAFAVQVLCDPDILIIDEALSVGDFFFQQKCLGYIRKLSESGVTLLFVSHDMGTVRDICKRAIFLKDGIVQIDGETTSVIQKYYEKNQTLIKHNKTEVNLDNYELLSKNDLKALLQESLWKTSEVRDNKIAGHLICVGFYDEQGKATTNFKLGSNLFMRVLYVPPRGKVAHVTLEIKNKFDQVISSLGSSRLGLLPPDELDNGVLMFELKVSLLLEAGNYTMQVRLGFQTAPNQGEMIDSTNWLGPITLYWNYESEPAPFLGMVGLITHGSFKLANEHNLLVEKK
jgi:lipopolysaccharide transport system ATP-binding protein